jgi:hypothetical protein
VFLRDLFWGFCFLVRLLTTCVSQLPTPSIYLLLILKFTVPLYLLKTAIFYSLRTDSVRGWYTTSHVKLTINKPRVTSFSRKADLLIYEHKFCQSSITRTDFIKDLEHFWILNFISIRLTLNVLNLFVAGSGSITFPFSFLDFPPP